MNGVELAKALSGSALHHALQGKQHQFIIIINNNHNIIDVFGGSVMLREGGNFDIWIGQTIGVCVCSLW